MLVLYFENMHKCASMSSITEVNILTSIYPNLKEACLDISRISDKSC